MALVLHEGNKRQRRGRQEDFPVVLVVDRRVNRCVKIVSISGTSIINSDGCVPWMERQIKAGLNDSSLALMGNYANGIEGTEINLARFQERVKGNQSRVDRLFTRLMKALS